MPKIKLSKNFITNVCKLALNEDLYPSGDITSNLLRNNTKIKANLLSNQAGIIGGLDFVKQTFKLIDKKIKVVAACGNGTAGIFAPDILRGIGCEVIELDCNLDYSFPKYNPNPEDMKMLHEIAKCVKENEADVGFGFDGDGDRVGVIDNNGNEIFADKIGLLIARNISENFKNSKFVVDVKSIKKLKNPVSLDQIKENSKLQDIALVKQSRLSVMPLIKTEWDIIIKMSN